MRTILGIEQTSKYLPLLKGKRIGLITNFSGISEDWARDTAEVLVESGCEVAKIFAPEHGLYGAAAGEEITDTRHLRYGIPVISLYGERRKPRREDIEDLEILVYDIQDVGLRYYTYIYTMCYTLEAAAEAGIPYVILDRPNPLGGRIVNGARMDKDFHSFVGDYELPLRYGLTIGELAGYYVKYSGLQAQLTVIPMENYTRDMLFPQTGLHWNIPSPALPSFESVICYCGGCFFESLNISEGRGSAKPFQMYGAPFIDMNTLYQDMKDNFKEDGLIFRCRAFIPTCSKYQGEVCYGLEFKPLAWDYDFLPAALALMKAIYDRYPDKVKLRSIPGNMEGNQLMVLSGNTWAEEYLTGAMSMEEMKEAWREQCEVYEKYVENIRRYQ